jgi:hypothetical protein
MIQVCLFHHPSTISIISLMLQAVSKTSGVTYLPKVANSEKFQLSKPSTDVPYWAISHGSYSYLNQI